MLVGYAWVSTPDQDPGYQLSAPRERGGERIFTHRYTGRGSGAPTLAAPSLLRPRETVVGSHVSRSTPEMLARTTK